MFQDLNGLAQDYIKFMLIPYKHERRVWYIDKAILTIPRYKCKTKRDRAFAIQGPRFGNNLLDALQLANSVTYFKLITVIFTN